MEPLEVPLVQKFTDIIERSMNTRETRAGSKTVTIPAVALRVAATYIRDHSDHPRAQDLYIHIDQTIVGEMEDDGTVTVGRSAARCLHQFSVDAFDRRFTAFGTQLRHRDELPLMIPEAPVLTDEPGSLDGPPVASGLTLDDLRWLVWLDALAE